MEKMPLDEVFVDELLAKTVDGSYSELHLEVGKPPCARLHGSYTMVELTTYEPVRTAHIERMIYDILSDERIDEFEDNSTLMFPYLAQHVGKSHVHIARDRRSITATFHAVPG
jgi:twitching motility protein PilT